MNGYQRLHYAAKRDGTWKVGGEDFAGKMLNTQDWQIPDDVFAEAKSQPYTLDSVFTLRNGTWPPAR